MKDKIKPILLIDNTKYLCDYGCGKLSKYKFSNGKYCCENHYNKCEFIKNKNRNTQLGRKRPNEIINKIKKSVNERMKSESKEERKKYGNKKRTIKSILKCCPTFLDYEEIREDPNNSSELQVRCKNPNCDHSKEKDGWFTPENKRIFEYRISCINKNRLTAGWFYCSNECRESDNNYKLTISKTKLDYYKNFKKESKEEYDKKYGYPKRITLEQIYERYPNFSKVEEIRYKPGEEYKRIIQGHCKNPNCDHSKETNGWFDLDRRQLEGRINALENPKVNANLYFFCSEWCKVSSGLFSRKKDNTLSEDPGFVEYTREVYRYTYYSVKENYSKIENIKLRSKNFHLDHKFSIAEGFRNKVDPRIVAYWKNLEILSEFDNISKLDKCSLTLEELLLEIEKDYDYKNKLLIGG